MVVKKSVCLFCSLGCGVAFRTERGEVTAIDYDKDSPVNHGALCPRGHYNLELINHPKRLTEPLIGSRKVSWTEAVNNARRELGRYQGDEIGIALSCLASNEAVAAVTQFAAQLGTNNVFAAGYPADLEAYRGDQVAVAGAKQATLDELESAEAVLIIGDILNRAPVLAKRINKVKYGKRGNKVIVIDPNQTHTSWFATDHVVIKPGTEAVALAEMAGLATGRLAKAAQDFAAAASGVVIYIPSRNILRNDLAVYFAKKIAAGSPNKGYQVYYQYGNTAGVGSIIDGAPVDRSKIKALVTLGVDLPTEEYECVIRTNYFLNETKQQTENIITLPLATHLESGGTFNLTPGRTEKVEKVVNPVGSKGEVEILELLAGGKMNKGAAPGARKIVINPEEVKMIQGQESCPIEPIVDFGDNELVSNFYWHRVNCG